MAQETNVKLIAISQGVGDLAGRTPQDVLGYIARVSNPSNQQNFDTVPKLLSYCMKKGHWSVFEQTFLTMEVKTSRAIAAQILRHHSYFFQEFSQRYAELSKDDHIVYPGRRQATENRQSSIDDMSVELQQTWMIKQRVLWQMSYEAYKWAIDNGFAKESARFVLPLSTATTLYMSSTVRSWCTYFLARLYKDTQLEHRQLALEMWVIFKAQFPDVAKALIVTYPEQMEGVSA